MRRRALTLVEVLVATVVCGAGVAVAAAGVAACVRAEAWADQTVRAAGLGSRLVARLEAALQPWEAARGSFAAEGEPDVRWAVEVGTTDLESMQRATVTISWDTPAGERELVLIRERFFDPLVGGTQ